MREHRTSRRDFLKTAAVGAAGLAVPASTAAGAERAGGARATSIKLGVASYSLRELTRARAIAAVRALRSRYVSVKSFHLPYESTPAQLAAGRKEFEEAGLTIVGGGVITLHQDDDADIRRYFEYAKRSGMPLMVIAPTPTTLPRIERFVREYGIAVAIHNHGPEDPYFPGPQDALPLIHDMDPRVGLCVDLGHTTRTGIDIVEAVAEAGDRVLDIHAKDLTDLLVRESQCIVGDGVMPIPAIFTQLVAMNYAGCVNLEYEIDAQDPLPGMLQSFAYMRGVMSGLGIPEG